MTTNKLSWQIKLGWAIGELGIAIYVGATMSFFLFYMTQAHGISPVWAGVALLIPRLWDGFTDPIMGAVSDRTHSKMGRRRPYLLLGSLVYGGCFWLVLAVPTAESQFTTLLYLIGAYILASTAITIFDVPYSSMSAEMTQNYQERTSLAGYKMVAARLGIVVAGGVGPMLYASQETLLEGFRLMGLIFGACMSVSGLITFFATRKAPRIEQPLEKVSLREEFSAVLNNRPFRILFSVFAFQNIAIGSSATMLVYFLTFAMGVDASFIGPLLLTAGITATLATPLWVKLTRSMGKKRAYTSGLLISATMAIPALFLPPQYYMLLFAIYFLAALGDAATQLLPTSMIPDTVEADEVRTGQRREGAIFGAFAFCRKLGMAFGAFFASGVLQLVGFIGGDLSTGSQTDTGLLGIRIGYTLLPFALWLCAILILRRYDLSESRFNEIKQKIADERHAAGLHHQQANL